MKNLTLAMSQIDYDQLEAFLDNRIEELPDVADVENTKDYGVFDVSELDGYLTAIVSGPEMILPSTWWPGLWGDFEPVFNSVTDYEQVFGLITQHMNTIATSLMSVGNGFQPLFLERLLDNNEVVEIVDHWCTGYVRAMHLSAKRWDWNDETITVLLMPIECFGSEKGFAFLDELNDPEEEARLSAAIPDAAKMLHEHFLSQRQNNLPGMPIKSATTKVGRNEPCPCGSGKKYKKCCWLQLH